MKQVYVDSNIFVAYYSNHNDDVQHREHVTQAFDIFQDLKDIRLLTSSWAITETVKVLIKKKKLTQSVVAEIENDIINEGRFLGVKLHFIDVSPLSDYDFKEFFYHVRKGLIDLKSHLGDVMHYVIMKNNDIDHILTLDGKSDFKDISGLTVIHPKDVHI